MKRNKLEIRVCGLQRSGNHAVINWIINQHKGSRACFLNNIRHGDYDPFYHSVQPFIYNFEEFSSEKIKEFPEELKNAPKDLLIYSYEDDRRKLKEGVRIIDSFYSEEFEARRVHYLGESERFIDILIVRDPYNFFASRLKKLDKLSGVQDIDVIVEFLKDVLREAVKIEEAPETSKLVIKYNQWFSDKKYRRYLSQELGGKFDDSTIKEVSSFGGGSSFDGTKFNKTLTIQSILHKYKKLFQLATYRKLGYYWNNFLGGAQKMNVMERWKDATEPEMQRIFADPEISDLSKRLFGDVLNM